jgi:osmotically-inducible protein OsmY
MNSSPNSKILFNVALLAVPLIFLQSCLPAAVVGGAGMVGYGMAQERSIGGAIDDAAIEGEVNALFLSSDNKSLFVDVDVDSVEGRVLLTGTVPDRSARLEAYKLAWRPESVKEVINEIRLEKDKKFSATRLASDSWITAQIESKLLFTDGVASINYSIETIDSVVYIMGIAKTKEELKTVTDIASKVRGVEKVVSHARIKNKKATHDVESLTKKDNSKPKQKVQDNDAQYYQEPEEVEVEDITKP